MAGTPTVDDYKAWARITDARDDVAIAQALDAVLTAIDARCPALAVLQPVVPDDVFYAALLWVNRLLARRNSPDGVVGVADLGVATVMSFDRDIAQMLSPWRDPVLS